MKLWKTVLFIEILIIFTLLYSKVIPPKVILVNNNFIQSNQIILKRLEIISKESKARDQILLKLIKQSKVINKPVLNIDKKPSVDYLNNITVLIIKQDPIDKENVWLGTGVVIKKTFDKAYIVTNKHVCDTDKMCYVQNGTQFYPVTIVKRNEAGLDLQIIKVSGHLINKIPIKKISRIKKGKKIYVMGHNLGRPFLYTEGVVAGFQSNLQQDLIISAAIAPGNSGSGVINSNGELVGLVYAGGIVSDYQIDLTHGLCINSDLLYFFLKNYLYNKSLN